MTSAYNYLEEYGKAEKAYLESNFDRAAEIINRLAEKFPQNPNIMLLQGHIYCYGFQNYDLAREQYKNVLKLSHKQDLQDFAKNGIEQIEQLRHNSIKTEVFSQRQTVKQKKAANNKKNQANKNITVTQGFIDKLIDKISNILKEQHALSETDEEQAEAIESLLDKLSSLENNFDELTKSLARGSYPLKLARSIRVAESKITPQITPVAISKAELISTYNEIPSLLSGYINPVSLTPDSYRGINSNEIVLETTIKGNYWAIATEKDKQYKYWLVPNNNLSFNVHKLKTIKNLFQLKGDYNSGNSEFVLQEPAVLSLLPNNKQWKLLQPGILVFGSNLKSTLLQPKLINVATSESSEIKQILSSLTAFTTEVQQLNSKVSQLEIQSEISQKAYQREKQEWLSQKQALNQQLGEVNLFKSQLSDFKTQIANSFDKYHGDGKDRLSYKQKIEQKLQNIISPIKNNSVAVGDDNGVNNDSDLIENSPEKKVFNDVKSTETEKNQDPKIGIKTKISRFRQDYTKDIKLISDRIVAKVAISVDTLEQITFYTPDTIILENTYHGKYWIIDYLNIYFLIPSEIEQITKAKETALTVARLLFYTSGYYPGYSSYHLIRPAIVTKISTNQWKLEEKGNFNFS